MYAICSCFSKGNKMLGHCYCCFLFHFSTTCMIACWFDYCFGHLHPSNQLTYIFSATHHTCFASVCLLLLFFCDLHSLQLTISSATCAACQTGWLLLLVLFPLDMIVASVVYCLHLGAPNHCLLLNNKKANYTRTDVSGKQKLISGEWKSNFWLLW